MNERLITNLSRQGPEELALVYRENLIDKEAERISPYILEFDENGEPDFEYEKDTLLGQMEYSGFRSMYELANSRAKYMIWLSPPGGISGYTEGRVVVGKVLKRGRSTEIECRGIPILKDRGGFRKIADNLGAGDLEVEELRKWAIGVNAENDDDFWDKCQKVFGVEEVWNYIREGKDVRNKKETEVVVRQVMKEIEVRGVRQENQGLMFEMMMKVRGFEIMGGNHGGTNMDMFGGTRRLSAFRGLFTKSEIAIKGERVDGKTVCPCGEVLKEGATRCPKCGLRLVND